jgi:hypothetical protein
MIQVYNFSGFLKDALGSIIAACDGVFLEFGILPEIRGQVLHDSAHTTAVIRSVSSVVRKADYYN